jgi:hypothetical protein
MFMVAPRGRTKEAERRDTSLFFTEHSSVVGRVAEELAVEKAVKRAWNMPMA